MNNRKYVVVTGGAGYVGSHICVSLIKEGYTPVIIDNLSNSDLSSLTGIAKITGHTPEFVCADLRDGDAYAYIFASRTVYAVIHCAGLKSISESIDDPIAYYRNNISATIELLSVMEHHGCRRLVFSSSACVYSNSIYDELREGFALDANSPYATSKIAVEAILKELHTSFEDWTVIILRYFNPAGAHSSGLIGERPNGTPNNLIPFISGVVNFKYPMLNIYGCDYATSDGTGVRDYVHIMDVAECHVSCILALSGSFRTYNVGTGVGHSVLQVVQEFEVVIGEEVPRRIVAKRKGDIDSCYANCDLIRNDIGWAATRTLKDIVRDQMNWENNNG